MSRALPDRTQDEALDAAVRIAVDRDARRSLRFATPVLALALVVEGASHLGAISESPRLVVVPWTGVLLLACLYLSIRRHLDRVPRPGLLMLVPLAAVLASVLGHLVAGPSVGSVIVLAVALGVVGRSFLAPGGASVALGTTAACFLWACYLSIDQTPWLYTVFVVPMALVTRSVRIAALREIELRRRAERELARREVELAGLRRVKNLAGGVAHHFNNLLTVMLGSASTLRRSLGDEELFHERLDQLLAAGDRASTLVRDLLITVGDGAAVSAVSFSAEALKVDPLPGEERPRGVEVVFEVEPDLPLHTDHYLLSRALGHLLDNAAEAGGEDSKVLVKIGTAAPDRVSLTVKDQGPGFSDEALERASDPFWTTREPTRTGLGLACARGLAELLGGSLRIANRNSGSGARVTLEVPRELSAVET